MANNDFDDILKSAFGEEEKPTDAEQTAAEAASAAEAAAAVPEASSNKSPIMGSGKRPLKPILSSGKFSRPASATSTGAAGRSPAGLPPKPKPGSAAASGPAPVSAAGSGALPPKPAMAAAATPAPAVLPGGPLPIASRPSGGQSTLLLLVLLAITFISLLISGAVLAKIGSLQNEMALLKVAMGKVEKSADRSWQIKCGIFTPIPNVRPQEYMIMYEEKDGKLIQKQLIIKPMEEKQ